MHIRSSTSHTVVADTKLHIVAIGGRGIVGSGRSAARGIGVGVTVPYLAGVSGNSVHSVRVAGGKGTVLVNENQH